MSSVKTYETAAMSQLDKALTHLHLVTERLAQAEAACDDFPTARHEIGDLKERAVKLEVMVTSLKEDLDRVRSK